MLSLERRGHHPGEVGNDWTKGWDNGTLRSQPKHGRKLEGGGTWRRRNGTHQASCLSLPEITSQGLVEIDLSKITGNMLVSHCNHIFDSFPFDIYISETYVFICIHTHSTCHTCTQLYLMLCYLGPWLPRTGGFPGMGLLVLKPGQCQAKEDSSVLVLEDRERTNNGPRFYKDFLEDMVQWCQPTSASPWFNKGPPW